MVVYKVDRLTRSLADFARLVELFDAQGVSFVSVTQQFNTTSSMGRLTLNVLLSFAQFEREVTGERIRDKIAASKKKGMWMGGNVPLGYDANGRTLVINPAEAETVRRVFALYVSSAASAGSDFNVMPTDLDVYAPERWVDDALFRPEVRESYRRLVAQGWTDALRALHPGEWIYTFWKYFRNALHRRPRLDCSQSLGSAGHEIDALLLLHPHEQPSRSSGEREAEHEPDRESPEAAFAAVEPFAEHGAGGRQEKDKQAARQDHAADGLGDINSRPLGSVNLLSSARFGFRWHKRPKTRSTFLRLVSWARNQISDNAARTLLADAAVAKIGATAVFEQRLHIHVAHTERRLGANPLGQECFRLAAVILWAQGGAHRFAVALPGTVPAINEASECALETPWRNSSALIVVVECKTDFDSNLVMRHPAFFNMAACLQHLEPADLPERARGAADGILDRVFDAVLRGTGDLDDPVDVIVGHRRYLLVTKWLVCP